MAAADRFSLHEVQKQTILQPECPVYIHCSRICTDKMTGSNFLQIRMVNRSDRLICSIFLGIEGLDRSGAVLFSIREMVMSDCNALPHAVFGENRLLALGRKPVSKVRITTERVVFSDGMLWRKLPGQQLTSAEKAGWTACRCGMQNPPDSPVCALCGRPLLISGGQEEDSWILPPPPPIQEREEPRPGPIVRHFIPQQPVIEEEHRSVGLYILLLVLTLLIIFAAGGFLYWCHTQNLI